MGATTTKEPRTFAELDNDPRRVSHLYLQAKRLIGSYRDLSEADAVRITLAVHQHRCRYFDERGMWGIAGGVMDGRIFLSPGAKPGPEDGVPREAP